ncbi:tetratricopeptide repeat protein [Anaeromyxobacter oryzisoli]|uniref:tetratricopeptide repeat protein n=1 Tax=Anaeromyxobacter oryzisoli TaxID=2925408 RepID=UPI001F565B93|nr:tetratricopeptide repeat protein [Anaeromyxobacter sp. SG63]
MSLRPRRWRVPSPGGRLALAAALLLVATGFSPFQAEQDDVRAGNEELAGGDPAAALRHYDAAEKAVGPRPEIDYDRGNALYRLGRHAEARDAWKRALDRGAGRLGTRALQNVGNALAAVGDRDGAIAAYTEALRADPKNEDARFDLEVLLRRKDAGERPPEKAGQGGQREQKPQDRQQASQPGSSPPQQDRSGEKQQQQQQQARQPSAQQAGGPERQGQQGAEPQTRPDGRPRDAAGRPEETPRAGAGREERPAPLSRQDAERLLDALRARERNMPIAPGRARKEGRRADAEKDW